jgi:hypothetical protein
VSFPLVDRIHGLCNNASLRRHLRTLRYPLTVLCLALVIPWIKPEWFLPGLIVAAAGEAIQIWCSASLSKNKVLAAKGPYALVRNPMYLGRYFLILGGVLMTASVASVIGFSVVYYLYMLNRVRREEANLTAVFGEQYRQHCARVNRFLPSFRNVAAADLLYFNWRLFFENRAHLHLLAAVLAYGILGYFTFVW